MLKREKEVFGYLLDTEEAVMKELEKQYRQALDDINTSIRLMQADEWSQSRAYHIQYQKTLKKQVEAILEKLHSDEYTTMQRYLSGTYTDAYVGTVYALHGQSVPVIMPIDQKAALKAVMTDSKINTDLYTHLGVDITRLKKTIRNEITRGIASGMLFQDIARNVAFNANISLNRAKNIAQTEGHRIQQASADDARNHAKAKGADVVKQWDSTLDGATRDTHRKLDGQIREVGEPFEMDGKEAMFPGDFNDPAEDCRCRCVALTRARSALDAAELATMKERAKFFGLDKTKDFEDFKGKYLKAAEETKVQTLPKKPTRPRRRDYEDDDVYEAARDKYRQDREQYETAVEKIVQENLNRERKYTKPADIKKWAESHSIDISDEVFNRVDARAFDDVIIVQEEMFKRFPQGKKGFEIFGTKYSINYVDDASAFMSANGGLNFHRHAFGDFAETLRKSIDMQGEGFTVHGDGTFRTLVRHEYGHNVDAYIRINRFNSLYEGKRNAPFEPNRRSEYERELLELANHSGASEYAKTNSAEAFAEGFAEYTSNPGSEYGKAFGKFLRKWLID